MICGAVLDRALLDEDPGRVIVARGTDRRVTDGVERRTVGADDRGEIRGAEEPLLILGIARRLTLGVDLLLTLGAERRETLGRARRTVGVLERRLILGRAERIEGELDRLLMLGRDRRTLEALERRLMLGREERRLMLGRDCLLTLGLDCLLILGRAGRWLLLTLARELPRELRRLAAKVSSSAKTNSVVIATHSDFQKLRCTDMFSLAFADGLRSDREATRPILSHC